MRWSIFNIVAEKSDENRCLLYNTFSDSQILCENKEALHSFETKVKENLPFTVEESEFVDTFLELGFLVEDDSDEKSEFLNWFEEKVRNNYEELSCLILTSRTCNLRCPYCFEKDVLDKGLNMPIETAQQVIAWNKDRITKHGSKKLGITFFGGEPLMNVPVLELIASELSDFCKKNDVEFDFGIVTNGVMLKREKVVQWKNWGLKWIKITFDGNQKEHDQLRVTQSGHGSFDKIWGNLEKLEGIIPIYIGGNFNSKNEKSLKELVDKLEEAKFKDNLFSVEFKPIQSYQEKVKAPVRTDFTGPAFDEHQVSVMMRTRDYVQSKGLPVNNQIGIGPCELHRKSFFGIDMTGKLYKCSAMVGREKFASGDVWQGEDKVKVTQRMGKGIQPWKDCGNCAFIPVCAGGCKAVGYERYEDFTVGSCDKLYFKKMVQEMFEKNLKEVTPYEDGLKINQATIFETTNSPTSNLLISNNNVSDDITSEVVGSLPVQSPRY